MGDWSAFPHAGAFHLDAAGVLQRWARLHAGDAEPPPADPAVLQAWVLFHNGDFEQACAAGLAARRSNPALKAFADRLAAAGKRPKVVLVAVARKLLVIANAVLRSGKPWDPNIGASATQTA